MKKVKIQKISKGILEKCLPFVFNFGFFMRQQWGWCCGLMAALSKRSQYVTYTLPQYQNRY